MSKRIALFSALLVLSANTFANNLEQALQEVKKPIQIEKIREIRDLNSNFKNTVNFSKNEINDGMFRKPVEIVGNTTLMQALSILVNEGYNVVVDSSVQDKQILVAVKTMSVKDYVNRICESADLWCSIDTTKKEIKLEKTKTFVLDVLPEGKVRFFIGSNGGNNSGQSGSGQSGGTSSDSTSSTSSTPSRSSGQSTSYSIENVNGEEVLSLLQNNFGIKLFPSETGFLMAEVTPKQWNLVREYFEERAKRKEVIKAEISLLRVDLNNQYQWGIDWSAFSKLITSSVSGISYGVNSSIIPDTQDRSFISIKNKQGATKGLLTALQTFGNVHKVDSWYYQMTTGTPVVFRNYQLVRYFTVGAVQSQSSTETTVEVNEDEVGFRGVLSIYKNKQGYYVDGFIDLSSITGYIEANLRGGVLKAPLIDGKSFRISTELSDLNQTLIIGGFRVKGIESTDKGVPLLSEIPILGYLFKGKQDLRSNSEFVVFITLKPAQEQKVIDNNSNDYEKLNSNLKVINN